MACPITGEPECHCQPKDNKAYKRITVYDTARKLWTDHAVYDKIFGSAFLDDLPEADALRNRLLDNQQQLGSFYSQYVGEQNGQAIVQLLTEHTLGAGGVLQALKSGSDLNQALQPVLANVTAFADAISVMTSDPLFGDTVYAEFLRHNQLLVRVAQLHFQKQYVEEIREYDAFYTHMLSFSDMLTAGLTGL